MKIKLKTYDEAHFVCAENGGDQELIANRTSPREWETFDVIGQFVFGGNISLRTYNGTNFVCAEDGGGKGLIANRTSAGIWETFKIIGPNGKTDGSLVQNGDKISLQTYDGKHYVCAEDGGSRELVANRTEAHEWETFTAQFASIALKTYDGVHFVCAENGGGRELVANRTEAHEWETFDVLGEFVFGGSISLRTYNGTNFVCAEDGGGKGLIANRTSAGIWETFKIIGPSGKTDGSLVQNGDKISLQTYDGKHYVCAEDGGSRELVANRTEAHEWETITVQFVSTSAVSTPNMRIIHISDTHFSDSKYYLNTPGPFGAPGIHIQEQDSAKRSETLANFLIQNHTLFGTSKIVITGDLTDSGDIKDYLIAKAFIDKLKNNGFEVYSVPGNHDYCKMGTIVVSNLIKSVFCIPCPPSAITSPPTKSCPHSSIPNPFHLPRTDCPINFFHQDNATHQERRKRFINYITGYSQYPHVVDFSNGRLVLLDSMQAELDENTGDLGSEGKLGDTQLYGDDSGEFTVSGLKQIVDYYQEERKKGKKIIISLHHSPFDIDNLKDADKFFKIVDNKIDCLLFGHTTRPGVYQQSFDNEKRIPLINCENLQNVPDDGIYPITVLDLGSYQRDVYETGGK